MGGAVSTGDDNDDLVDNLVEHACITSCRVERVFRAVDRGHYFTEDSKDSAYKDTAWRSNNLHLSAPCIYSSVLENLELKPGHSFLNIGSGTGYVSTMAGLLIGSEGVNHGVELYQDVIDYAYERLDEFLQTSPALDQFDFCPPKFFCGNGLLIGEGRQYDRVYCGARCPHSQLPYLKNLLKIGGVLVVPVNDHLFRVERLGENNWDSANKLSVSFAQLVEPSASGHKEELVMPPVVPDSLQQLCRRRIRSLLRESVFASHPDLLASFCSRQEPPGAARPGRQQQEEEEECRPPRRTGPVLPRRRAEHRGLEAVFPQLAAEMREAEQEGTGSEGLRAFSRLMYGAVAQMMSRANFAGSSSEEEEEGEGRDEDGGSAGRRASGDEEMEVAEGSPERRPGAVYRPPPWTTSESESEQSAQEEKRELELEPVPEPEQTPAKETAADQAPAASEEPQAALPLEAEAQPKSALTVGIKSGSQPQCSGPTDASPVATSSGASCDSPAAAAPDRAAGRKRPSEEAGAEAAAGAAGDAQKRGRRDKFDSGLGDSDDGRPARGRADPENGVAVWSSDSDSQAESGKEDSDDEAAAEQPEAGGGAGSSDSEDSELDALPRLRPCRQRIAPRAAPEPAGDPGRERSPGDGSDDGGARAGSPLRLTYRRPRGMRPPPPRRRPRRQAGRAAAAATRRMSELMRLRVAALPLPPALRLYVNLGRPLERQVEQREVDLK